MKYDVFISYSSLDQKVAEGVCAYLEQHRIRCFIAYRDIPRGVEWAEVIPQALLECRVMVIIFSDNFNASEEVNREITIAVKSKKIILPFRISDDDFKGLKLYYLCGLNWIDAFPNPEKSFGSLCESVQKLLKKEELLFKQFLALDNVAESKYQQGLEYAERNDPQKAVQCFLQAAEQGHVESQYTMGFCYAMGMEVSEEPLKSVYWFRKAAEQNHEESQYQLGSFYEKGYGVPVDLIMAASWYRKAAQQGNANAQNKLKELGETW